MALVADILLIAGALGAAFYCVVLSRRLSRFSSLEQGVGGAVSALSTQVAEMTETLERTQAAARESSASLEDSTRRAETAARNLELLLASMHDIPTQSAPEAAPRSGGPEFRRNTAAFRRREAAE
ncbi:MAG: hypothetical protein KDA50_01535 [Rhodobacteraceae bacterium]|nr:hypothetical protein [Paracoccaceae bacterium]